MGWEETGKMSMAELTACYNMPKLPNELARKLHKRHRASDYYQQDAYEMCNCGSGIKYKWCCRSSHVHKQ